MALPLADMVSCPLPQPVFVQPNPWVPICPAVGVKLQIAVELRLEPEQPRAAMPENWWRVPLSRLTRS